jgi:predicted dehydrogenase
MKALFIGLGGIGQRHLRNLRTLLGDEVEILAYRVRGDNIVLTDTLAVEGGASLEEKYRVRVFDDLYAALGEKPEVCFVCNPSSLHIPAALAAARAGAHLFIEKPLANDMQGIDSLIACVREKKLVGLVGYQMRFHPLLQRVSKIISENLLGRIVAVRAEVGEYLPGWHPYEDYRRMYAARSDQGGGVVLSQIHELDYLCWLFGMPENLFAVGGRLGDLDIDVEDTASVLMNCGGVPVQLHQDYLQRPPSRCLQVIGSAGKLTADLRMPALQRFDARGALVEEARFEGFERNHMFMDEMKHFLAAVRGKCAPMVSISEGADSLRVALAIKKSLATGQLTRPE